MALFREALALGRLPRSDPFSFTSTVDPVVHHEWGMGAVLYLLATSVGGVGLAVLRDLLAVGAAIPWVLIARRRGVDHGVLWATLPVAIVLMWIGLTTVRAQLFTLLFISWLMWFLTLDREGKRWWIVPWLAIYVCWVNLHAGFVVGAIGFGMHAVEQALQRRPVGHLAAALAAMALLTAVNPYGLDYFPYLWEALRMERPLITEWQSILSAEWELIAGYLFSLVLLAYGLLRGRWKEAGGLLFLAAAAYAATKHQRHLTIYATVWACTVPALLQGTPFGRMISRVLTPSRMSVTLPLAVAGVVGLGFLVMRHSWQPLIPSSPADDRALIYPVGAVDYLRESGFEGNLLTPFEVGAFVSWNLYPRVLVSMDGRFEVAYAPELLERHLRFFGANEGWQAFLNEIPARAVLVESTVPVAERMRGLAGWRAVYRDDAYEVFERDTGQVRPMVDRRGIPLTGRFP